MAILDVTVQSQLLDNVNKPNDFDGLIVATNLSILPVLKAGFRPDLIVIDECHHVGSDNTTQLYLIYVKAFHFWVLLQPLERRWL